VEEIKTLDLLPKRSPYFFKTMAKVVYDLRQWPFSLSVLMEYS
jgi:hypothetical protein